ncbi:unnamed protein product [Alopecurus aequalis]
MGIDRNTTERSRGTARHTRDVVVVVRVGRDFRFTAGIRGTGGLRGAGGHAAGVRSLLSSDVGVAGSSRSSVTAAFVVSSPVADSCVDVVDVAGDGAAEAASPGDEGCASKGAVLIGGSDGRASSAKEAIAVGRIGGENSRHEWVEWEFGSNSCSWVGARGG